MPDAENARLPRNRLTFFDRVKILITLLPVPIYLVGALLKAPFTVYGRSKSWKRIIADRAINAAATALNRRQLRVLLGTTSKAYEGFMKSKNLSPVVEELGLDARLFWIGEKRTDRVVLYFHGGAYLNGALESTPFFWWWMKEKLAKKGKSVGFAMLNYTLIPDRTFPTQLSQAILAIQHVLKSGVSPGSIQLAGDSAGGQLIHQVLSHILHPVEHVPLLNLDAPFAGCFFISPWTRLRDPEHKYLQRTDGQGDYLSAQLLDYWGEHVLEGTPKSALPYLEANEAPEDWFKGLPTCTRRVLISAGGLEVLFDEIIKYAKTVESHHNDTTVLVQETGVHIDPMIDFFVGDDTAEINRQIADWLDQTFTV